MHHEETVKSFQNIIGGKHIISEDNWALSLVRRLGKEHAFLIIEGVDNGTRYTFDAHLVVKDGSNNTKADIIYSEVEVDKLLHVGEKCHSITWNISRAQAVALRALIEAEKARADEGRINYVMLGGSKAGGIFAASLDTSGLDGVITASQASVEDKRRLVEQAIDELSETARGKYQEFKLKASYMSLECVDLLLREGHNCCSWAVVMIQAIQIKYNPGLFKTLVIVNPSSLVQGNTAGDEEPTSGSRCTMF